MEHKIHCFIWANYLKLKAPLYVHIVNELKTKKLLGLAPVWKGALPTKYIKNSHQPGLVKDISLGNGLYIHIKYLWNGNWRLELYEA